MFRPGFPYLRSIGDVSWEYDSRNDDDDKLVFRATLASGQRAIVKFAQYYSPDVHRYCAERGVAPQLYAYEELPLGWKCIVMEWIEAEKWSIKLPDNIGSFIKDAVGRFVKEMYEMKRFVHGDLRTNNILWRRNASDQSIRYWLVDFDFAGVEGEATYPPHLNTDTIKWPDGVAPFAQVRAEHDRFFIGQVSDY